MNASYEELNTAVVQLGISNNLAERIRSLYLAQNGNHVLVASNLKTFVCGELRTIIGRLKSKWKIANDDKPSEFDKTIAELVEKMDANPVVSNLVSQKLESISKSLENVDLLNTIASQENKYFAFLFMLVNTIVEFARMVPKRQADHQRAQKQIVIDIVLFILRMFDLTNELNTFSADRIKHSQEALREKSKENIIAQFEGMDEASRRAVLELKKAGYQGFVDIMLGINSAATATATGTAADPDADQEVDERYTDYAPFRGDNNENNIDEPDVDEDNYDAWESPDD
jgi:hypothetical protein